ncbi:MAG: glycosyltransferase family 39 protein [Candidatus Omnitrophica bacterium]|nr:glycosyltransferase family 39 protein [Candidatus Omnitrophota bacterium]
MRKKTVFMFLLGIMFLGLILRLYNLNFPSIGYQKIYPQVPLVSYQILTAWQVFGENLWGPRLVNVVFGIFSIIVAYQIAYLLFCDAIAAVLCSFVLAVTPVAAFFSRNLQPESPALFWLLLGSMFYLKYVIKFKAYDLLWGGFCFFLSWLYKGSFIIGLVPLAFCLPFQRSFKDSSKFLKDVALLLMPYLMFIATILWFKRTGQWGFQELDRVKILEIFTPGYWRQYGGIIWWYIYQENFTLLFTVTTIGGLIVLFSKGLNLAVRYAAGWIFAAVIYGMVFSDYINQHNYYQIPFILFVSLSSGYFLAYLLKKSQAFLKNDLSFVYAGSILCISLLVIYPPLMRMHSRVFLGQDIAGESLKEFTRSGERVFLFTHCQGYGVARYAHRYAGWPAGLEDFKDKQKFFNIRYVCIYPASYLWVLRKESPEVAAYLVSCYHIKELGFLGQPFKLAYFIFERGKGQGDIDNFLDHLSGQMQVRTNYSLPEGKFSLCTMRFNSS